MIGVSELTLVAKNNTAVTFNPILPFAMITGFYLSIIVITNLLNKIFTKNIIHK
ncbi:MAG: hypothetical protein ACQBVK_05465 [Candidatus Phytoplasma sp. TWB_XP]